MNNIVPFEFNGQGIRFENRNGTVWGCLTDMGKATGKSVADWNRLKSTTEYLTALESDMGKPMSQIIQSNRDNSDIDKKGTWAIDEVVIDFAAWVNVEFRIWVNRQIKILMSEGEVSIKNNKIALPPPDIRIVNFNNALSDLGIEAQNPRYAQAIKDSIVNKILGISSENENENEKELWLGVVERAEELGYSASLINRYRSSLGKFVKKNADRLNFKKEKRLCNGSSREIYLYQITDELDETIQNYLESKLH